MRLILLTRGIESYTTRRLFEVARARGHEVEVVDPVSVVADLVAHRPRLWREETAVAAADLVIPRFGPLLDRPGLAALRQLEHAGVASLNSAEAIARVRDKLSAAQHLVRAGFDLPPTAFATRPEDVRFAIDLVGGPPVVIKAVTGMQGKGVLLARTREAAFSIAEALTGVDQPVLIQSFIEEAAGADLRVLVVDGEAIAAVRRIARDGDFRANAARGARVAAVDLAADEAAREAARVAVAATRELGLRVGGCDLLETDAGPILLEVNASPGFQAVESASAVDVATAMITLGEAVARGAAAARAAKPRPGRLRVADEG